MTDVVFLSTMCTNHMIEFADRRSSRFGTLRYYVSFETAHDRKVVSENINHFEPHLMRIFVSGALSRLQ